MVTVTVTVTVAVAVAVALAPFGVRHEVVQLTQRSLGSGGG